MVFRAACLAALLLLAPSAARAVTVDDIIELSKAGVPPEILVALIDADRTMFTLTRDQIIALRAAGVPSVVVVKMLGSRREFAEHAPPPPPPLIVGEGPPPRTVASSTPVVIGVPLFVPVVPVVPVPVVPVITPHARRGFGRFMNDGWIEGRGFGRFINQP